jgi:chromosome partitioning protein
LELTGGIPGLSLEDYGEDKMPHKLVIANQKGGVAKTTTTLCLARYFADRGMRVLIVDTDPQGSITLALRGTSRVEHDLHDFIVRQLSFDLCRLSVAERIDVLPSNKETTKVDAILGLNPSQLFSFRAIFAPVESSYDVMLFDCAPSISVVQTAALIYAQCLLIPVAMDILAIHGALACLETAGNMNEFYRDIDVRAVALLPVMVDRRLQATKQTLEMLEKIASKYGLEVLPPIRTDQAVQRANRGKAFLADHDPRSKALEDYAAAASRLAEIMNVETSHVRTVVPDQQSAPTVN